MNNKDSLILTVDTGGSKTQLTLYDSLGTKLSRKKCIGMGYAEDKEGGFPFLAEAIEELMGNIPRFAVTHLVINLGGKNTEQVKKEFENHFPNAKIEAFRESSGVIMSAICESEEADAILMAGTGTIALSKGKTGSILTDGWGVNIGDRGSGYWIGLEAISRSLRMLEEGDELSPLCKHITGLDMPFSAFPDPILQKKVRDSVRSRFVPLQRAAVAALTKVCAEYAKSGDKMAIKLFQDAGKELAATVLRGLKITNPEGAVILLSGGLTKCFELWGDSFTEAIKAVNCNYVCRLGKTDMSAGALYYARRYMLKKEG